MDTGGEPGPSASVLELLERRTELVEAWKQELAFSTSGPAWLASAMPELIDLLARWCKLSSLEHARTDTTAWLRASVGEPCPFETVMSEMSLLRELLLQRADAQSQRFLRRAFDAITQSFLADVMAAERVDVEGTSAKDLRELERTQRHMRFLVAASSVLNSTLDLQAILDKSAALLVPEIADWSGIVIGDDARRFAVVHRDPSLQGHLERVLGRYASAPAAEPLAARDVVQGNTLFSTSFDEAFMRTISLDDEHARDIAALDANAIAIIPLVARGQVLGKLGVSTGRASNRQLTTSDIGLLEDFAGRVASAVDNARLYELAQRAIKTRDEVLAAVSHDLRNSLGSITLAAHDLTEDLPESELGNRVRNRGALVHRAASSMQRLIDDLVDLASIEAGHLAVRFAACEASALVKESMRTFFARARERSIQLVATVETGLPLVFADRDRVLQVLGNLLSNALMVTPSSGRVVIGCRAHAAGVEFYVMDTGPGIETQELPRLFERYFRGTRSSYKGSGLGLSIAKGIVEAHGGRIDCESTPGSGATFRFTVPGFVPEEG